LFGKKHWARGRPPEDMSTRKGLTASHRAKEKKEKMVTEEKSVQRDWGHAGFKYSNLDNGWVARGRSEKETKERISNPRRKRVSNIGRMKKKKTQKMKSTKKGERYHGPLGGVSYGRKRRRKGGKKKGKAYAQKGKNVGGGEKRGVEWGGSCGTKEKGDWVFQPPGHQTHGDTTKSKKLVNRELNRKTRSKLKEQRKENTKKRKKKERKDKTKSRSKATYSDKGKKISTRPRRPTITGKKGGQRKKKKEKKVSVHGKTKIGQTKTR